MNFDKLKKAAKDTFKKVSSKIEEKLDTDEQELDLDIDDFTEEPVSESFYTDSDESEEETIDHTQRFDLKNMLDRFKKKTQNFSINDLTDADSESSDNKAENTSDNADVTELKTSIDKLDEGLSQITTNQSEQIDSLKEQLDSIKCEIDEMRENSLDVATKLGNIDDGINLRLGSVDKKLTDVANAVASVSKLNDSIFDLKNAQMNTRNSLTDLETSFKKLKRKMSTSITIISILTAIIAILEVINLLS